MDSFIGRSEEVSLLKKQLSMPSACVMIYGKRKVGKTTLIRHVLDSSKDITVYYECIKGSLKQNVAGLVRELVRGGLLPSVVTFANFVDLFSYIDSQKKQINVVIDEYPYLKEIEGAAVIDSQFQSVVDNHLKHIRLFLSGSHVGMMKTLLHEKNALYGRFSLTMHLKELNYKEAAAFYSKKNSYDKVAFYSVFGGSPFVNSFIDAKKSLKANIVNTVLNKLSPVYNYAEFLLLSDFSSQTNAERIIYSISNGKKKYNEIENFLGLSKNGKLSKQVDLLLDMEILSKVFPINKPGDKKKSFYELDDNILRFYYAFVYKNKSALEVLGAEAFYDEYIKDSLTAYVSHRFEDICRTYFSLKVKSRKLDAVKNIGIYYYDDISSHTNGEFDVALEKKNGYEIYEAKFLSSKFSIKDMKKEALQINAIRDLSVNKIGFISINGFESGSKEFVQICGDELYS